jgi:hypothetical protein
MDDQEAFAPDEPNQLKESDEVVERCYDLAEVAKLDRLHAARRRPIPEGSPRRRRYPDLVARPIRSEEEHEGAHA